jgi:hypothetical protein
MEDQIRRGAGLEARPVSDGSPRMPIAIAGSLRAVDAMAAYTDRVAAWSAAAGRSG